MAKRILDLRVFVACPSDCDRVRPIIRRVLQELNTTVGNVHNAQFSYSGWDTDVVPGAGARAQAVINDQIGDDYDVFVGVLANRFGSPTGTHASGTEEEFELAMSRFRASGAPRIMVYRDSSPVDPASLDLGQLAKVRDFFTSIQSDGVLTWNFADLDNFENTLRVHIARALQDLAKPRDTPPAPATPVASTTGQPANTNPSQAADIEDLGVFDAVAFAEDGMAKVNSAIERLSAFGEELAQSLIQRSASMRSVNAKGNSALLRAGIDSIAGDMDMYADRVQSELTLLSQQFRSTMDLLSRGLVIAQEDLEPHQLTELPTLKSKMMRMADGIEGAIPGATSLRGMLSGFPRLTARFNQARRQTVAALDRVEREFRLYANWVREAASLIH